MGLPADQLSPNERVVLETREHWKHLLGAILICAAAVVGLALVVAVSPDSGFLAWLDQAGWIAFVVVVAIFGLWPVLGWWNRTYTLTTERLATRSGILRRKGRDIPLNRINDVAFDQGLLDRLVGCGTLRVSAASEEGTVVLNDIPHVHAVSLRMNELVRALGHPGQD